MMAGSEPIVQSGKEVDNGRIQSVYLEFCYFLPCSIDITRQTTWSVLSHGSLHGLSQFMIKQIVFV